MTRSQALYAVIKRVPLTIDQREVLTNTLLAYNGAEVRCYEGGMVQVIPPVKPGAVTLWLPPIQFDVETD